MDTHGHSVAVTSTEISELDQGYQAPQAIARPNPKGFRENRPCDLLNGEALI